MITPKDLALKIKEQESLVEGGRWCAGCSFPPIIRTVLAAAGKDVITTSATGCLEVTSTIYPYSSWGVPFMHNAFENSASTLTGLESAYKYLQKDNVKAELKDKIKGKDIKFVAFGGDGGTYDIGLQALSGALERGHDFLYVCYDNGAYMNTGNQRSSATPFGAAASTAQSGKAHLAGKEERRKDLIKIALAHNIKYVAQASAFNLPDLYNKAEKAFSIKGPKLLLVYSPCISNWQFEEGDGPEVAKLATETNFWPLYEVEDGKYKLNYKPASQKPIEEFLKRQNRFKHLFKDENSKKIVEEIQQIVNKEWQKLQDLVEFTNK